jgi:hypothetical protein
MTYVILKKVASLEWDRAQNKSKRSVLDVEQVKFLLTKKRIALEKMLQALVTEVQTRS